MIFSHNNEKWVEVKYLSFKKAREASGMTQQELAKEIGVDQSAVCLWETGKTQPRAKMLPRIAKILNCSVDELLSGEVESPTTQA